MRIVKKENQYQDIRKNSYDFRFTNNILAKEETDLESNQDKMNRKMKAVE